MTHTANGNETLDFDPRNLPQEYLAAIGLLSAAASSTDSIIEYAIAGLLDLDAEQGWAVTAHMPAPLRMSVLRSAAEIAIDYDKALDELDVHLDQIKAATDARNQMIHGSWCVRPSNGQVMFVKQEARTHVEVQLRAVAVDEIERKALTLYEVGMNLMRFCIALGIDPKLPRQRDRGVNTPKARKARRKKTRE